MSRAEIDQRVTEAARILDLSAAARPQAQAAFRRPAPACGDGPRHRAPSAGFSAGRAALQSRRQAARADARRTRPASFPARRHHRPCHPRPDRGDDARQSRRGVFARRVAAIRRAARHLPRSRQHLRRRLRRQPGDELLRGRPARRRRNYRHRRRADRGAIAYAALASVRVGDKVLVGIRPEHLRWRPAAEPDAAAIRGRVELVEQLEPESYVVVSPADPALVIRSADEFAPAKARRRRSCAG